MTTEDQPPAEPKASRKIGAPGCLGVVLLSVALALSALAIVAVVRTRGTRHGSDALAVSVAMIAAAGLAYVTALGLFRLRPIGRILAIVWCALILTGAAILLVTDIRTSDIVGAALAAITAAVAAFAARALTRPAVRRQFSEGDPFTAAWWIGGAVGAIALAAVAVFVARTLMDVFPQSRQKRTMADLRSIATALEARATDLNAYPPTASIEEIAKTIEPTYIKKVPREDGWGYPFRYEAVDPFGANSKYHLGSSGRGGVWDRPHLRDTPNRATTQFDCDIVFSNGSFLQYPEGVQTQ